MLCVCLALLGGCGGGQEIESCLFVLAMAIDPAPDGNLTVTVKALSGTQEATGGGSESASGEGASEDSGGGGEQGGSMGGISALEQAEPGYIVLSATASSCLRALSLLSATTPRNVNLSQLREVVINRTLAESDATLSILKEIHSMYNANGGAIVVVTPDDAGDFIRRQRAILGIRLSKYLEVLFDHFAEIDTIPPDAQLSAVIAAMESSTIDATAVYAAGNNFENTLVLPGTSETDRLPGHLPRTSPAENEYLGSALFSGPRMTGVLTGDETGFLCLMMGKAKTRTSFINGAQYKTNLSTRVVRNIDKQTGTLDIRISMNMTLIAGEESQTARHIAAQIEEGAANVLRKLQTASCDAIGFGRIAVRRSLDIPGWESIGWENVYVDSPVKVTVRVDVL